MATVTVQNARRTSRIVGAAVFNEKNEQVGTVDDLILGDENKVAFAVISIGGVLGVGSRLVAVPYDKIQVGQANKIVFPGATKDQLNAMPRFTYPG
ncbi:MAG: PRC-barrel domain-containing protein [Pseudomonadota bacterium]|nr:PRC-barrel domain-containing protein [Pseudomonadota bacterium]